MRAETRVKPNRGFLYDNRALYISSVRIDGMVVVRRRMTAAGALRAAEVTFESALGVQICP